jgi:hypothetical protein
MSFMRNQCEPNDPRRKDAVEMNVSKQTEHKTIKYVDTQVEMNEVSRNLKPGEIVAFRNIDPEILQWLIDFEWTDTDEEAFGVE